MKSRRQFDYRTLNMLVCGDGRRVFDKGFKIVPQTSGEKCIVILMQDGEEVARGVGVTLNDAADLVVQQVAVASPSV